MTRPNVPQEGVLAMPYPRPATYRASKLAVPVTVLAERLMFGRTEYLIRAGHVTEQEQCPDTAWVTDAHLTFHTQED